ncbi:hypothetical protein LFLEISCH_09984 [Listeria fleischmannii subsp. fleischmannii LU2006-1]|nr:hypothetical protein LFLEISCH_09984 [Listeria fleischmannii subsp. fleischmannii LU2006-1]
MVFWILGGGLSFILFIIGVIILFFPKRRKVGAIMVGSGMVLMIASIVGIFIAFKSLNDVSNSVINYSSGTNSSESSQTESKVYDVNLKQTENQIESKINEN